MRVKRSFCFMLTLILLAASVLSFGPLPDATPAKAAGTNLIDNPGFESGTTQSWQSMGTATLAATTAQKNSGTYSALVSGRRDTWNGIAQSLLGKLSAGKTYNIVGRVRLANSASDSVKISIKQTDANGETFTPVSSGPISNSDWTELRGSFTFNPSGTVTELLLYVEGPAASVNFYVDDVEVVERSATDWKAEANARIEQIRKRDTEIKVVDGSGNPVPGATVDVKQTKHKFGFGSAINTTVLSNPTYANFFKEHFEVAVFENEAKWYANEPSRGNVTYADADRMLAFAEENDIAVRGHTVHWEVEQFQPEWVKGLTGTALRQAMDNRIESVVKHFKGKFISWDVNNEMLHGSFFKDRLGNSIWTYMYQRTRELDPDAKLFVNDYNVIEYGEDNAYKQQMRELLNQGAPIDGIGAQGHFSATVDPIVVKQRLDNLATLNLPIWISEYDSVQPNENIRADNLETLYRIAFSHPAVEGIMMWGFWAGSHWRGADAAIVNQDWTLNAAGKRYEALMDEWTTNVTGTSNSEGTFSFRGFHGTYDVIVTLPGYAPVTKTFVLDPGSSTYTVTIEVDGEPTAPAAPTNLTATAGNEQVALSWKASSGATSYNVKRTTTSGGPYTTIASDVTATSYTDKNVTNGTTYYYVVSAENATGESANSAQVSATPQDASRDLVVQYRVTNPNATDNTVNPQFNIKNNGSSEVNLNTLKIRYYFTKEGNAPINFWCDWARVGCSNISGKFVTMDSAKPGADTYLEITFSSGAGSIAAGGQSGEIQTRSAKSDWSNFNEAGDYSFDATKTSFVDWNKVTLYQNDQLVWGVEP